MGLGESFATTVASGPMILALGAALLAGLVSFASPCVIPLVPGYLSYLAGLVGATPPRARTTTDTADGGGTVATPVAARLRVTGAALLFVLGFTVVFVLATASVFGAISVLALNSELLMRIGGVVTILMGVVFLGFLSPLQRDVRLAPIQVTHGVGAPLLGGVFALGWTPCRGPGGDYLGRRWDQRHARGPWGGAHYLLLPWPGLAVCPRGPRFPAGVLSDWCAPPAPHGTAPDRWD